MSLCVRGQHVLLRAALSLLGVTQFAPSDWGSLELNQKQLIPGEYLPLLFPVERCQFEATLKLRPQPGTLAHSKDSKRLRDSCVLLVFLYFNFLHMHSLFLFVFIPFLEGGGIFYFLSNFISDCCWFSPLYVPKNPVYKRIFIKGVWLFQGISGAYSCKEDNLIYRT